MRFKFDLGITGVIFALIGYSLALIWSTNQDFLIPQIIFFSIGLFLFLIISQLTRETFENLSIPFYIFSILILLITLISPEIRGTNRWLNIFGFRLQSSELTKPLLIVSFSYFLSSIKSYNLSSIIKLIILFLIPLIIIFFQPDLGNFIVYFFFMLTLVFANQLDFRLFIVFLLLSIVSSPFLWKILRSYQKERLLSFLSPGADPQGVDYN